MLPVERSLVKPIGSGLICVGEGVCNKGSARTALCEIGQTDTLCTERWNCVPLDYPKDTSTQAGWQVAAELPPGGLSPEQAFDRPDHAISKTDRADSNM